MPEERDGFGFDKTARLDRERAEDSQEAGAVTLEDPFPYRQIPFDARIFGARPSYIIRLESEDQ